MKDKNVMINWDEIQTIEDIKNIIKGMGADNIIPIYYVRYLKEEQYKEME